MSLTAPLAGNDMVLVAVLIFGVGVSVAVFTEVETSASTWVEISFDVIDCDIVVFNGGVLSCHLRSEASLWDLRPTVADGDVIISVRVLRSTLGDGDLVVFNGGVLLFPLSGNELPLEVPRVIAVGGVVTVNAGVAFDGAVLSCTSFAGLDNLVFVVVVPSSLRLAIST